MAGEAFWRNEKRLNPLIVCGVIGIANARTPSFMTRKQLIATGSVIAVIIAFTVAVKIVAANSTPPKIELPAGAFVAPMGSVPPVAAPSVPVAVAPAAAPAVALPQAPAAVPTPAPAPAPAPAPVGVVNSGPAGVEADSGLGGRRLTNMGIPAAPVIGIAATVAPAETPPPAAAPAPLEPAATPEIDRRVALELQRREQRNGAVNALIAVQRQLGSGDTSGVDQALAAAAASMNAVGQRSIEQARAAIANKDLTAAAFLINQAVTTAATTAPVQP